MRLRWNNPFRFQTHFILGSFVCYTTWNQWGFGKVSKLWAKIPHLVIVFSVLFDRIYVLFCYLELRLSSFASHSTDALQSQETCSRNFHENSKLSNPYLDGKNLLKVETTWHHLKFEAKCVIVGPHRAFSRFFLFKACFTFELRYSISFV